MNLESKNTIFEMNDVATKSLPPELFAKWCELYKYYGKRIEADERTFVGFVASRGYPLNKWQAEAAEALLVVADKYNARACGSGKTTLMQALSKFIEEHGNDFVVPGDG